MRLLLCLAVVAVTAALTAHGQYIMTGRELRNQFYDEFYTGDGEEKNSTNGTTGGDAACATGTSTWLGFACAGVSVAFFGINYLPVKKVETGDGMFFQWIVCIAIWMVGLVIYAIMDFPPFQPLAMLGGALWATGNITVVPIVKMIGLGMGLLIWGLGNLLFGWASGRFGILGIPHTQPPCSPLLNDTGIVCCVIGLFFYFFVKTEPQALPAEPDESTHLLAGSGKVSVQRMTSLEDEEESWTDRIKNPTIKKLVAIGMSLFAGALYGVNFNPVTHLEQKNATGKIDALLHRKESEFISLDYVFPHWCGILLTSTLFFIIYCIAKKNRPKLYPRCILPGLVSGLMWAIADASWFIANERLSQAVAYPLITTGPGFVGAFVGIVFFKEIQGKRNFIFLGLAFFMTVVGVTQVAISKTKKI